MSKGCGRAVCAALIALALTTPAIAAPHGKKGKGSSPKFDQALQQDAAGAIRDVIITVRPGTQAGVRKRLAAQGLSVTREHGLVHALTVSGDARGLMALAGDPDVESISTDADVTPSDKPGSSSASSAVRVERYMAGRRGDAGGGRGGVGTDAAAQRDAAPTTSTADLEPLSKVRAA